MYTHAMYNLIILRQRCSKNCPAKFLFFRKLFLIIIQKTKTWINHSNILFFLAALHNPMHCWQSWNRGKCETWRRICSIKFFLWLFTVRCCPKGFPKRWRRRSATSSSLRDSFYSSLFSVLFHTFEIFKDLAKSLAHGIFEVHLFRRLTVLSFLVFHCKTNYVRKLQQWNFRRLQSFNSSTMNDQNFNQHVQDLLFSAQPIACFVEVHESHGILLCNLF